MSRENVEIVQGYLEALESRGIEAALEHLDPRVQLDWSRSDGPYSDTYTALESWATGLPVAPALRDAA